MNFRFLKIAALISSSVFVIAGCGDNSSFETPADPGDTAANSGAISQTNFSLLTADVNPAVIDETTGVFTKTDVELTIYIGDRNNQVLTDAHTINFIAEYGLVEPSCVTENGSCTVTWSAIKRPVPGGPANDGYVTITAYTVGEEGFIDINGNNLFDDGDTSFDDLAEPFVDADKVQGIASNGFSTGDIIIDVVSTNDPTGANQQHDMADGFYNGSNCTHSSLCGTRQSTTIFDDITMNLVVNSILSRTIGGTVSGLAGTGLVLQNNSADDLPITANGNYTFTTPVDDGQTYTATILTQPSGPSQVCSIANSTGTVSANVTNVDVTCSTNTFTIGGTVTGIPGGESVTLQNNNGDDLNVSADGSFVFATPIADGATYSVTVLNNPASASCTPTVNTGSVSSADITNVVITCL